MLFPDWTLLVFFSRARAYRPRRRYWRCRVASLANESASFPAPKARSLASTLQTHRWKSSQAIRRLRSRTKRNCTWHWYDVVQFVFAGAISWRIDEVIYKRLYLAIFVSGVASQYHGASIECMGCNKPIRSGSITVQAPRIGEEVSIILYNAIYFQIIWTMSILITAAVLPLDGRWRL